MVRACGCVCVWVCGCGCVGVARTSVTMAAPPHGSRRRRGRGGGGAHGAATPRRGPPLIDGAWGAERARRCPAAARLPQRHGAGVQNVQQLAGEGAVERLRGAALCCGALGGSAALVAARTRAAEGRAHPSRETGVGRPARMPPRSPRRPAARMAPAVMHLLCLPGRHARLSLCAPAAPAAPQLYRPTPPHPPRASSIRFSRTLSVLLIQPSSSPRDVQCVELSIVGAQVSLLKSEGARRAGALSLSLSAHAVSASALCDCGAVRGCFVGCGCVPGRDGQTRP